MGTVIRPETSLKNEYHISRHRYYELKHFCMQYSEWKKARARLRGFPANLSNAQIRTDTKSASNPTALCAEARIYFQDRMDMIEECAKKSAEDLAPCLVRAVTEGLSYAAVCPPCCREVWYTIYRRFFWLLDKRRK